MKSFDKKGFKLPYLGSEKFKQLTKMGLGYKDGGFFFRNLNNVEGIKHSLCDIFNEKIVFNQTCTICGVEFLCERCKYYIDCITKDLPLSCFCENCINKENLYELYTGII
jgi:hypothetical protein